MTPEDRFSMLCDVYGIATYRIRAPNRSRSIVEIRRKIALSMRNGGYSFGEIGRAMSRDHSTVMNMIRPRSEKRRLADVAV